MTVPPEQVELVARRVTDGLLGRMRKSRDQDDRMMADELASLVYRASYELMAGVAGSAAPDEFLVNVSDACRHSVAGFSGIKVQVVLVVATNHRLWFCTHRDGAVQQLQPLDYGTVQIKQKRLSLVPKLEGTTITCGSGLAEVLTALQSGQRQPAPWLVAPQAAPPGWHPDPHRRHQLRYWDGSSWTPHVSDGGVTAVDPI